MARVWYVLYVCAPGRVWQLAGEYRRDLPALNGYEREVARGTRSVRLLEATGRQVACYWPPREHAA